MTLLGSMTAARQSLEVVQISGSTNIVRELWFIEPRGMLRTILVSQWQIGHGHLSFNHHTSSYFVSDELGEKEITEAIREQFDQPLPNCQVRERLEYQ